MATESCDLWLSGGFCTTMKPASANIQGGDKLQFWGFILLHLILKAYLNKVNVQCVLKEAILENESGSRMNLQCGSPNNIALDSADKERVYGLMNLSCW